MPRTDMTHETLDDGFIRFLIDRHTDQDVPRLTRLWEYYRNAPSVAETGATRTPQHDGLPQRLQRASRETVIENDIAWRIHTMVDFMFGQMPTIESLAPDPRMAEPIEAALRAVFEGNGGIGFFQNLALLGAVYGFADVIVRPDTPGTGTAGAARAPSNTLDSGRLTRAASRIVIETVEAPRAVPVPDVSDYRRLDAYIIHFTQPLNKLDTQSFLSRLFTHRTRQATRDVTQIITPRSIRTWHHGRPVAETPNILGVLPVVHIQNLPQPLAYEGLSEVEGLIALQNELNTRLSDRANRVTLQSFKMYLGKGIEGFTQRPVEPGQMWLTENPDASIESFGGDAASPSEDAHINEIREAMDKTSGVSPLAAGVLRNKVGNLTSENALRVTLMGLLAKTQRKRVTYGRGIERICALVLHTLHVAEVLHTREEDRRVCLHWASPLPENTEQRLREAQLKVRIGVPREKVLAELGYCAL